MGLDMWFREDVTRILASTLEVMRNSARSVAPLDVDAAASYQRGFFDALLAVAVAFGVRPPGAARSPATSPSTVERAASKDTSAGTNGSGWR